MNHHAAPTARTEQSPQQYVQRFALWWEHRHGARNEGRILAWLLLTGTPQSVKDIEAALALSPASISTALKTLERQQLVQRTTRPGDRRTYHTLHRDPWKGLLKIWQHRIDALHALALEARTHGANPEATDSFITFSRKLEDAIHNVADTDPSRLERSPVDPGSGSD